MLLLTVFLFLLYIVTTVYIEYAAYNESWSMALTCRIFRLNVGHASCFFSHKCLLIVHLDLDSVPLLIVHLKPHTYAQVATSFLLYTPTPTLSRNIFHICDLCQENNNLYQSNVGNEWC